MRTSTVVFDRADAVLRRPIHRHGLARATDLDVARAHDLAQRAAATLIASVAEGAAWYRAGSSPDYDIVVGLAQGSGVTLESVEIVVAHVASVVTSVLADLQVEEAVSGAALAGRLAEESRTLLDLGLVEPSAGFETTAEIERLATETRNVARVRIQSTDPERVDRSLLRSACSASARWVWWSLAMVASMVLIAIMISPP